ELLPRLLGRCPQSQPERSKTKPKVARPSHEAGGAKRWAPDSPGGGEPGSKEALPADPERGGTRLHSFICAYSARAAAVELWNSNPAIFDLLLLLFDRSEFLAELAIRTPDLIDELLAGVRLRQRKSAQETLRELRHGVADADQHMWLRRYHQAELMRIGLR